MANNPSFCGVCDFQNITNPSIVWCSECSEGLCSSCKIHHNSSRSTKNHNTVPIADYQKLPSDILEISQYCSEHNEHFQTFCKKHDCPCCRKCVIESHNKCEYLSTIDDVTRNVKSSHAFQELQRIVSDIADNMTKIKDDGRKNKSALQEQRTTIENEIKKIRTKVNQHLDKIQEAIIAELNNTEIAESTKIDKLLETLDVKHTAALESQSSLCNVREHASELQTFLVMKQLEKNVVENVKFCESVEENGSINQLSILYNANSSLLNFESLIQGFGKIRMESISSNLKLGSRKEKEAQTMVASLKYCSIERIKLHTIVALDSSIFWPFTPGLLSTTFKSINTCSLLPSGNLVLSIKCVKPFQPYPTDRCVLLELNGLSGYQLIKRRLDALYGDMTFVKSTNKIAASGMKSYINIKGAWIERYFIHLMNETTQIEKTLDIQTYCKGVTCLEKCLIFCAGENGIKKLDLANETVSDICNVSLPSEARIVAYKDRLYYTNGLTNTVSCCDMQGEQKWEFKDERVLKCPLGVSVDGHGNLYVVGNESENVVVFSADGQTHKELLTTLDGLDNPHSIDLDCSNDKLLVANEKNAFVFKIERN